LTDATTKPLGPCKVLSRAATLKEILAGARRLGEGGEATQVMRKDQRVSGMVERVLFRQATARAGRTGETFGDALDAVLKTRAGGQLVELRGGTHRDERADRWQKGLALKRAEERDRDRREARRDAHREEREEGARVLQEAAWRGFVREEMREMELRKDGQLAGALNRMRGGSPAPLPAALWRLASQDRRLAKEGLVALLRGGKVSYKRLDDLTREDRPARIAANKVRSAWLKERRDGWLVSQFVGASS